jgi:glyoxylase-like metal-dependent hydrolase (beta-lactamase superfamily II)
LKVKITKVVATHAHEEHVGNLNWLSDLTASPIYVSGMTARFLTPFKKLPWVRAAIIGQPPNLEQPYYLLVATVDTDSGCLQVVATPGHCDDHIVLYDPKEKLLLAGDAFMGSYFATPNPDVDSRKWLVSLERLMELDIDILVEGHGHIHTLRADIPDFPGVVIREDPEGSNIAEVGLLAMATRTDRSRVPRGTSGACHRSKLFPVGTAYLMGKLRHRRVHPPLESRSLFPHRTSSQLRRKDNDQLPTVYEVRMSGRG